MAERNKRPCKFYLDEDVEEFLSRIGTGERSRFLNDLVRNVMEIKLNLDQRNQLDQALSRTLTEIGIVSQKFGKLGYTKYKAHYENMAPKVEALRIRLSEGEILSRGSSELAMIDDALFTAEVQCRNEQPADFDKAKGFFELRKYLEEFRFPMPANH